MRYSDHFSCCGEHWVVDIPYDWADNHREEFEEILDKHIRVQRDHLMCPMIAEVKAFFVESTKEVGHGF